MKPNLPFNLCIISIIISLTACYRPDKPAGVKAKTIVATLKPNQNSVDEPAHVFIKGDSSCVIVNNKTLCIPKKYKIDLKNVRPFICQVKDGLVDKNSWLLSGHLTLISILEDTDRGYTQLYAIDGETKTVVKDKEFKRDYLLGFGLFVVNDNKIFIMHKHYNDYQNRFKSSGSLYAIRNNQFGYIKSHEEQVELNDDDVSIINFSKNTLNKKY